MNAPSLDPIAILQFLAEKERQADNAERRQRPLAERIGWAVAEALYVIHYEGSPVPAGTDPEIVRIRRRAEINKLLGNAPWGEGSKLQVHDLRFAAIFKMTMHSILTDIQIGEEPR